VLRHNQQERVVIIIPFVVLAELDWCVPPASKTDSPARQKHNARDEEKKKRAQVRWFAPSD
jgi:hypothetical protein